MKKSKGKAAYAAESEEIMSTTQPIKNKKELQALKHYYRMQKPNPRNYLLIIMGLNSALRISDILHLTYGNFYDYQKKKWKSHLTVKEQKTGKTNCIYINREIHDTLLHHSSYKDHLSADYLFASQMHPNQPLSRYQAYRIIKEAASYAGLPEYVSCHSLRKTFGYHAWKQGVSPVMLMSIYNHSSYQITKHYLCIDQDDKDAVFLKIKL